MTVIRYFVFGRMQVNHKPDQTFKCNFLLTTYENPPYLKPLLQSKGIFSTPASILRIKSAAYKKTPHTRLFLFLSIFLYASQTALQKEFHVGGKGGGDFSRGTTIIEIIARSHIQTHTVR